MAKTSKGVILSQASQIKSDYSFALIKATADNKSLVQDASSAELKVNALVEYSKDSQWDPKKLTSLGFPAGCFLIVDLRGQDIHASDLITNLALVRQYGYQAGVIDDLSTLDDIKALKANQIYLINSGKTNDDQDAFLNGNEITDGSGKLAVGMSVKWQRDYTNVDVSGDHAGFVGMGQDTLLKGGNAFGYSTNGRDFNAVITPKGLIFRRPDAERMWRLLKPNEIADINSTVGDKVKKEVDSATAEIPAAVSAANSAVSAAESAVAASKVNSDAIVAQSEAISEAKSAMDSATAEIQQTAANAASDAAKIRADVAQVQSEVDTAKAANSASVEALKSDIDTAKQDLANVHDSLTKAQSAVEQNQKLINDSVAKISNDISQDRKDLATAQQNNADLAKQLDDYSKQAEAQSKTIKSIQDKQDSFTATLADVQGNVSQVSDKVDGLSASLKDTQGNVATVKAQADQLNATLTDHAKSIATLTASAKELSSTLEDADGRLSKVEQTAQTNSSTLSDVQGDLSQVKQQADGLVTTLKDAQGDIDQIKQTAKGTTEQLSNAQGDITALQKDVNGVKLTIADHDKNIHTLQADSKTLKDDMTDAKGNISSLQKTATSLDSEFKDHDGRISKVEQTANTLTNEFLDQQGHLNRVEQTAQGTQQTVANQQGQINTIKTDADGIHETLTGQGNQLASLNVTLSNLDSKYSGITGDLKTKQTALTTEQQQTKDMLLRKADKSEVDNVKGTVNQVSAEQKTMADQINQKVSSTEYQTLKDKVDGLKVGGRNLLIGTSEEEVSGKAYAFKDYQVSGGLQPNMTYTLSGWARLDQTALNHRQNVFIDAYSENWHWSASLNINGASTPQYNKITFTTPQGEQLHPFVTVYLSHPDGGTNDNNNDAISGTAFIKKLKLEEGNVDTDYTQAPEDTIAQIQKNSTAIDQNSKQISLKADQAEVDQVKQTASQNSSRIDVMAGQISSKVTSTDVNNIVDKKGYVTTSTVQSLITQKAGTISESITNLDQTIKQGAENNVQLVRKSEFEDGSKGSWNAQTIVSATNPAPPAELGQSGMKVLQSNIRDAYEVDVWYSVKPGEKFDVDFWCVPSTVYNSNFGLVFVDKNKGNSNWLGIVTDHSGAWKHYTGTITAPTNAAFARPWFQIDKDSSNTSNTAWLAKPSIRRQNATTVAAIQQITASIDGIQSTVANKADKSQITQLSNVIQSKVSASDFNNLRKAVDLQTLDSADINNMKTNGHYFVHNLANNPVGGWVYVDVTGNGNDRIRQDVYQDQGNQHKYRRWNGINWTTWDEAANYSEITQLQNEVNLRVAKGDLLSQINLTAGNTLIQSNKLYLDASSVAFSGRAFIPSASIVNLDASKLTFYGTGGTYATMGSSVKQYDEDKLKSTINLQYNGGVEVHASNELGSILTMHDDTIRLAVKSQVYGSGSGQALDQQYSGVWAGSNYVLMNSVDSEGNTTGISIGSGGNVNQQYRFVLYDDSKSNVPSYGVKINTQRFDLDAGSTSLYMGPTGTEIRANDYTTLHGNDKAWLEGGHAQVYLHDGVVEMHNLVDGSAAGLHVTVQGWATFSGYVEAMGWTTKSTLSSKTRIEPLDTADALDKITSTDLTTYQYKAEVSQGLVKRHAGLIIDDVHDVAQYSTPDAFVAENRQGRSDADIIGYLMGAVQELKKQLDKVKKEVKSNG